MRTPVRIALLLSFCCFLLPGWGQMELDYDRPVSFAHLPFPYVTSAAFKPHTKPPGCAVLSRKKVFLYVPPKKRSLIRFNLPETLETHTVVSRKTGHCFGDSYYYDVIVAPEHRNDGDAKNIDLFAGIRMAFDRTCWVPVGEIPALFHYTPIISTIKPKTGLPGHCLPEK